MRRLSSPIALLVTLAALLLAPRPARACTEHPSGARAAVGATIAPTPGIPASARATEARIPAPSQCCAGAGGCDAPMPCCIAAPGTIPPALAATHRAAELTADTRRPAAAPTWLAPDRAALAPEPPPPRA